MKELETEKIADILNSLEKVSDEMKTNAETCYSEGNNRKGNLLWDRSAALRREIDRLRKIFCGIE